MLLITTVFSKAVLESLTEQNSTGLFSAGKHIEEVFSVYHMIKDKSYKEKNIYDQLACKHYRVPVKYL